MNEETNQEIRKYQFQIILLFGILISVFLSISILVLIKDLKEGKINQQDALEKINIRNKIASIISALVSLYFFFDALENYRKNPTKSNFITLIVILLLLIAISIRIVNLITDRNDNLNSSNGECY